MTFATRSALGVSRRLADARQLRASTGRSTARAAGNRAGCSLPRMPRKRLLALVTLCGLAGFVLLNVPPNRTLELVGVGLLSIALLAGIVTIVRLGLGSESDREHEAQARELFERTGRWPGE
jgi:hypothetical protein